MISCKRFSRHIASGVQPLPGGIYQRLDFWLHWAICPFCRRYWKEIKEIGEIQRVHSALANHPAVQISEIQQRLKAKLLGRAA